VGTVCIPVGLIMFVVAAIRSKPKKPEEQF